MSEVDQFTVADLWERAVGNETGQISLSSAINLLFDEESVKTREELLMFLDTALMLFNSTDIVYDIVWCYKVYDIALLHIYL